MLASVVIVIRVSGLRSLSKMSSFDFAVTVAIGSILASTVTTSTPYLHGALAVGSLLGLQAAIAVLRRRSERLETAIDNTPMLLMRDGEMIDAALSKARVTTSDVIAKLREANALQFADVHAVVLETTGDISVLHGDGPFDDLLLDGVRDLRAS
jgi:uncharacterized membrane protein YcaP (DUF421 family)